MTVCGLKNLKYILSGPLQKQFAGSWCKRKKIGPNFSWVRPRLDDDNSPPSRKKLAFN